MKLWQDLRISLPQSRVDQFLDFGQIAVAQKFGILHIHHQFALVHFRQNYQLTTAFVNMSSTRLSTIVLTSWSSTSVRLYRLS